MIIILQYCDGFGHTSTWIATGIHVFLPSWNPLPYPSPHYPSGCPSSCLELALVIYFTYGNEFCFYDIHFSWKCKTFVMNTGVYMYKQHIKSLENYFEKHWQFLFSFTVRRTSSLKIKKSCVSHFVQWSFQLWFEGLWWCPICNETFSSA